MDMLATYQQRVFQNESSTCVLSCCVSTLEQWQCLVMEWRKGVSLPSLSSHDISLMPVPKKLNLLFSVSVFGAGSVRQGKAVDVLEGSALTDRKEIQALVHHHHQLDLSSYLINKKQPGKAAPTPNQLSESDVLCGTDFPARMLMSPW